MVRWLRAVRKLYLALVIRTYINKAIIHIIHICTIYDVYAHLNRGTSDERRVLLGSHFKANREIIIID